MDAWVGVVGTLLGTALGAVFAYLTGERTRRQQQKGERAQRTLEVAASLLQLVDEREQWTLAYLDQVGEFPGEDPGEEWYVTAHTRLALVEIYAPESVFTAGKRLLQALWEWHCGYTPAGTREPLRESRSDFLAALHTLRDQT